MKTIDIYLDELAERLIVKNGESKASLMVGAGFSKNAISLDGNSMPDFVELGRAIYNEVKIEYGQYKMGNKEEVDNNRFISGNDVINEVQSFIDLLGRAKVNRIIEKAINDDNYNPGVLHKKLIDLAWEDIFTTNYDTLLERAVIEKANKENLPENYTVVYDNKDIRWKTNKRLIKLHGTIGKYRNYVIARSDYEKYKSEYKPLVIAVLNALQTSQLYTIGFSGADINFLRWHDWLKEYFAQGNHVYMIGLFDSLTPDKKKTYELQKIRLINLSELVDNKNKNNHAECFEAFFEELSKRIDKNYVLEKGNHIKISEDLSIKQAASVLAEEYLNNEISVGQVSKILYSETILLSKYFFEKIYKEINSQNVLDIIFHKLSESPRDLYDVVVFLLKEYYSEENRNDIIDEFFKSVYLLLARNHYYMFCELANSFHFDANRRIRKKTDYIILDVWNQELVDFTKQSDETACKIIEHVRSGKYKKIHHRIIRYLKILYKALGFDKRSSDVIVKKSPDEIAEELKFHYPIVALNIFKIIYGDPKPNDIWEVMLERLIIEPRLLYEALVYHKLNDKEFEYYNEWSKKLKEVHPVIYAEFLHESKFI